MNFIGENKNIVTYLKGIFDWTSNSLTTPSSLPAHINFPSDLKVAP